MFKNPPYECKDDIALINGKPFDQYTIVSKGDWFIKGSKVLHVCGYSNDGALHLMEGWVIKDYQVKEDQETCGLDEFIFIDNETKEEYEFDPEHLGIIKGT